MKPVRMARVLALVLVGLVASLALAGCDQSSMSRSGFDKQQYVAQVGEPVQLRLLLIDATKGQRTVAVREWIIEPSDGAEIDNGGQFTATAPGEYWVTAKMPPDAKTGEPGPEYRTRVQVDAPDFAVLYDNENASPVKNGGKAPTVQLLERVRVTLIRDYHDNNGQGTSVSGGAIGLRAEDGTTYGPWAAETDYGPRSVQNAYWIARPNVMLPPGKYVVIDSDVRSWSQNKGSNGFGMVRIEGVPDK